MQIRFQDEVGDSTKKPNIFLAEGGDSTKKPNIVNA